MKITSVVVWMLLIIIQSGVLYNIISWFRPNGSQGNMPRLPGDSLNLNMHYMNYLACHWSDYTSLGVCWRVYWKTHVVKCYIVPEWMCKWRGIFPNNPYRQLDSRYGMIMHFTRLIDTPIDTCMFDLCLWSDKLLVFHGFCRILVINNIC